MSKIMTNQELIARMKELYNEPNYYGSGGSNWSSYVNGGWYVDCTCSIKAILWGGRFIPENRGKAHAGCKYGSNGVPDFTPAGAVEWTNATRGNFNNLVPGELLIMTSHGHAGLYIGDGNVLEVTPAWTGGNPGCQISQIGKNGERIKNGRQVLSWEYHGKIPVVDYVSTPTPKPEPTPSGKFKVGDEVILNGPIYVSSSDTNPANYIYNKTTKVTRDNGSIHKYNTTGDLGWCDESSLTKVEPPKPEPTPVKKTNEEIAKEVIAGKWDNYPKRKELLEAAGYDYETIRGIVNKMLEPTPKPTELGVGDTVEIIGLGYSNTYGTGGYTAGGLGWTRTILKVWKDGNGNLTAYPYQVGLGNSTTGFYKAGALQKK